MGSTKCWLLQRGGNGDQLLRKARFTPIHTAGISHTNTRDTTVEKSCGFAQKLVVGVNKMEEYEAWRRRLKEIHSAVYLGHDDLLRTLLVGFDVNDDTYVDYRTNELGILGWVAWANRRSTWQIVIEAGADVNRVREKPNRERSHFAGEGCPLRRRRLRRSHSARLRSETGTPGPVCGDRGVCSQRGRGPARGRRGTLPFHFVGTSNIKKVTAT